jgi:alpha-amylase/alpha-mannosidase (GH57 family)
MTIWHATPDASRPPQRIAPGQVIPLVIGTWPIEPGQAVWVEWETIGRIGRTHGATPAAWRHNAGVNSFWSAELGPFADGDRLTYAVRGSCGTERVNGGSFMASVKPTLYVAWLWHQHQPLYRDSEEPTPEGSFRYPWVRLHAIRDYYSMAALAGEHDVHITINLTPVLLRQIDDYLEQKATDRALELSRTPAEELMPAEVEKVLSTFFEADWHHQIYIHPRYRELLELRMGGASFSPQDLCDLQMWFNLAWFGHEFRSGAVTLITGEVVDVHRFVRQERGFSHDDVLAMLADQYKILRAIVPIHRALQDAHRIEVSTTPAFHPILPLLIDTDRAYVDRPGTSLPTRYAYPEDAAAQVKLACTDYAHRFGRHPAGMWPAEGAVSSQAVDVIATEGIRWVASDAGVLARSGQWGYRSAEPDVLCQPYRTSDGPEPIVMFFRDTDLSDGIGFRYGHRAEASAAVDDFMRTLEARFLDRLVGDDDRVLTIVLDGENAWGGYPDDGRPFLKALYHRLETDARFKTVTFSEYLRGNPARGIAAHPAHHLARVYDLATGSWIDESGSASGVDLGTWIGEPEENAAWNLLGATRAAYARATRRTAGADRARESLFAAEGSDWFWWFGSDQESRNDAAFDEMFRAHLKAVYSALDLEVPDTLDDFIVAHPVVWTFTRPLTAIRRTDQLLIRTNCPGRLTFQVDDLSPETRTLVAVGGVMAGTRRFQITIGPFPPSAHRLEFRFHCEHPGCDGRALCCAGETQAIALGRVRRSGRSSQR